MDRKGRVERQVSISPVVYAEFTGNVNEWELGTGMWMGVVVGVGVYS